ncbi:hypothetical protein IV503_06555 [Klebsiella huaxiensis]|uniref:DUF5682 family protein n=1 Tax=Klebsiella huaxiensis TaxID=2153354 RepID=UPI002F3228DC
MNDQTVHLFGIRHHGPGSARSLLSALEALQPDCLLVEGPPDGESMLPFILHEAMQPPVALLIYAPDESRHAAFYPFANFSPEWQALRYGLAQNIAVRFIDLPIAHQFALENEEAEKNENDGDDEKRTTVNIDGDPLDWLGYAAGYADGESWWNQMVEEREDDLSLFDAIREAMNALRQEIPNIRHTAREQQRENLREAHMRKMLRQAKKEGFARIAVVCGAWHVPALENLPPAKADNELLKGLPKIKVAATWTPWSNDALSHASGYGAGVTSPEWYDHLWRHQNTPHRDISWLSRAARLFREEDFDCSSAHVIETVRLAQTLAVMRNRPQPGLDELCEALQTVVCMGENAPMRLIQQQLIIGDALGCVPEETPAVPLQRDITQQQKTLRLKAEASDKLLDLDLRKPGDLARSHLLHRLALLDIPWGHREGHGHKAKGTFHEVWSLRWEPALAMNIITASRWGNSVEQASTRYATALAERAEALPALAKLIHQVLLADLQAAIAPIAAALESLAAITGNIEQLLETIPPLVTIARYGNVRQTDGSMVIQVLMSLVPRAAIALPGACTSLNDDSASRMRKQIVEAHAALRLLDDEALLGGWLQALTQLANGSTAHALLRGTATRLLFDMQTLPTEEIATQMGLALSAANAPADSAAWAEGFLNDSAMALLHNATLWQLIDSWLSGLSANHFRLILPMLRRTFANFTAPERRQLGERAVQGKYVATPEKLCEPWNEQRAALILPLLRRILPLSPTRGENHAE